MSSNAHVPVLLGPVLQGLKLRQDGIYVDGTFGRGGHSGAILQELSGTGRLIAFDRDPDAIAKAAPTLTNDPRFELIRGDFAQLATCMDERGLTGRVDGLVLDLGVSSPQLDEAARGFSFLRDGPLDMRMDPSSGISAAEFLRSVEQQELSRVIRQYGDERHAGRIAREIVAARQHTPVETTGQLANLVAAVVPARGRKRHAATKTFQAIRIYINRELEQLKSVLVQTVDVLRSGGRLCVISFHSLEDRIVKRFIRDASLEPEQYRGLPEVPKRYRPTLKPVGKAITATADEIAVNVRARSARLRVAERL